MKTETEIKLELKISELKAITEKIEEIFAAKKSRSFRQVTHQFFFNDWTTQNVFPRIRNEEDGRITLTVKVKSESKSDFFERLELETEVTNSEEVIRMMPHFGFPKKISWEKRRSLFKMDRVKNPAICFYLDETPIGWFLEMEGNEAEIERAIAMLGLQKSKRIAKSYLGLWEDYKKKFSIENSEEMFFKPTLSS